MKIIKNNIKILFIIICINLILFTNNFVSFGQTYNKGNIANLYDGKIKGWKQLDNAKIVLSNGQIIASLLTEGTSHTYTEPIALNDRPTRLFFLLDYSGSMFQGNSRQKLKKFFIQIIENLKNSLPSGYDEESDYYKISIKVYGSKVDKLTELFGGYFNNSVTKTILKNATLKQTLDFVNKGELGKIKSDGGNFEREAIEELCNSEWDELLEGNLDVNKFTILITDGGIDLGPGHKENYDLLNNKFKEFLNKFNDMVFITFAWDSAGIDKCNKYLKYENRGIVCDIEDPNNLDITLPDIFSNTILNGKIEITELDDIKSGIFNVENKYYAIVDDELLYGATLVTEYSIHIKSTEGLNFVNVIDYLPEGMKCMSTNYESERTYDSDNNILRFNNIVPNDDDDEIVIKMTLSTILSTTNDFHEIENKSDLIVETDDGVYSTEGDENNKMTSAIFSIIPPFGKENNSIFLEKWQIILIVSIFYIFLIVKILRKSLKGKYF